MLGGHRGSPWFRYATVAEPKSPGNGRDDTEPEGGICHITLDPHEVGGTDGAFFVAELDGAPRACGAYRRIGSATAEVKRMWAEPELHGSKLTTP